MQKASFHLLDLYFWLLSF